MRPIKAYDMDSLTKNIIKCQEALSLMERARNELMSIEKYCGHDNDYEEKITYEMLDRISEIMNMNELYLKYLNNCKNRLIEMQAVYGSPPALFGLNEDIEG